MLYRGGWEDGKSWPTWGLVAVLTGESTSPCPFPSLSLHLVISAVSFCPMAASTAAMQLRESFGDRKVPDISRKIKACVACRKLKVAGHRWHLMSHVTDPVARSNVRCPTMDLLVGVVRLVAYHARSTNPYKCCSRAMQCMPTRSANVSAVRLSRLTKIDLQMERENGGPHQRARATLPQRYK